MGGKKKAAKAAGETVVDAPVTMPDLPPEEAAKKAEELKALGNTAFAAKDFAGAAKRFSEALAYDGSNHVLYSNRSACHASLKNYKQALSDALHCVQLKPEWPKGYSRLATAQAFLNNYDAARVAYKKGLDYDPGNAALMQSLAECEEKLEALRLSQKAAAAKLVDEQKMRAKAELEAKLMADPEAEGGGNTGGAADTRPAPPTEYVIGIDLGTTYSCVGVWRDGGVEIIPNQDGERTTASYVAFTDSGRLVGESAKRQGPLNPKRTLYNIKRIIGRTMAEARDDVKRMPFSVVEGAAGKPMVEVAVPPKGQTRKFAPEEVSAMVLQRLKEDAESYLGRPVKKAVVTVPAYFNDHQRRLTKDAGAIAGLDVLRIINEPTAAALAYGLDLHSAAAAAGGPGADGADGKGTNVLVFDLGGGTFDVSLLTIANKLFEVRATAGDTHLGGEDFDNALVDWLLEEFKKQYKKDYFGDSARRLLQLRAAAERAKRALSGAATAWVELEVEEVELRMEVSRAKFEKLNEGLFLRCLDSVKRCLTDAGVKKEQVDEVVLVGGSTRIPRVQAMLADYFNGKQLCKSVNPDEAVAYGAAVQGAILSGVRSEATQALLLMDVIPLTLGIETEGRQFAKVVPRNSTIPVRKAQEFTTTEDWQTEVDVCIYEGERTNVQGNHLLGKFTITGIERAKRGVPKVEVAFEINTNGLLTVTARDKTTGASAKIAIAGGAGRLSPEEVERMRADAERYKEEDEKLARQVEAELAARDAEAYGAAREVD